MVVWPTDTWGNQVPVLAKAHEVIVADSRGHGRSTRSGKPFGYKLMADDYLALLDHLKIDKVALVGWSDGGIIGLDIAMRHPERIIKLWAFGANAAVTGYTSPQLSWVARGTSTVRLAGRSAQATRGAGPGPNEGGRGGVALLCGKVMPPTMATMRMTSMNMSFSVR